MLSDPLENPRGESAEECFVQCADDCTGVGSEWHDVMDGRRMRSVLVCEPCAKALDADNERAYERNQSDLRNGVSLTVQQQYDQAAEQKARGR